MTAGDISAAAAALGRLGGAKGGKARTPRKLAAIAKNLQKARAKLPPPEVRQERARKAAAARWAKRKEQADG